MQATRSGTHPSAAAVRAARFNQFMLHAVTFALLSLGFAQITNAGVISTQQSLESQLRQDKLDDLTQFVQREEVGKELLALGVAPEALVARLANMTGEEISDLHDRVSEQVAGGDALALIGGVFLVLLILEVVGVTDVFKSV